jgi:uncharacterized BrkB/YihY/UPF0761 family membrane protein
VGVASDIDAAQRKYPALGVPIAVIYKYFDDQGNYLAAVLTYYAFLAIFPLMLLATSILGFVLQGYPSLEKAALDSTLAQFPIIGTELGRPGGLQGSVGAIVFGFLGALYGALGLGLSLQTVQATAWAVPRNSRPHPVLTRLTSVVILGTAGLMILGISVLSALATETKLVGDVSAHTWFHWLVRLITVGILGLLMTILLRMAAAKAIDHDIVRAAPGGFTIAILWQLLQVIGTSYVTHVLNVTKTGSMNAVFGLVLGLMLFLYLASIMGMLGIEVNVVLAEKLWPRALATPFTDRVDLTDADRKAYAMYAQSMRHKGFQTVSVRFDGRDGDSHEIVLDPRTEEIITQHIPGTPPPPEHAEPEDTEPIRQVPQNLPPAI